MQLKKQQLEPDMKQQTGSKSGKKYIKAVYCHPAYLTCRLYHVKCQAGWHIAGIKIVGRNINNLRFADDTTIMAESKEEQKSFLVMLKEESGKSCFKIQH